MQQIIFYIHSFIHQLPTELVWVKLHSRKNRPQNSRVSWLHGACILWVRQEVAQWRQTRNSILCQRVGSRLEQKAGWPSCGLGLLFYKEWAERASLIKCRRTWSEHAYILEGKTFQEKGTVETRVLGTARRLGQWKGR